MSLQRSAFIVQLFAPSSACAIPLAAPDREHRLSATMRPLSSIIASSTRLEPVEGTVCQNGSANQRPPHPFLPKTALNPARACFRCLPAALQTGLLSFLIGTPPIGSSRLVCGALRGMFHGGRFDLAQHRSHTSPFNRLQSHFAHHR